MRSSHSHARDFQRDMGRAAEAEGLAGTNGRRRPEQIQADIERTRTDLNRTLSDLEQRLSPGELMDQGLQYLRHSGARQYLGNLGAAARRDPIPLALAGVGLAWLMMSNRRGGAEFADTEPGEPALAGAQHKARQWAQAARERAGHAGDTARRQAERVQEGYRHFVEQQPLALGALGLAVGALLASAAPGMRAGRESMPESGGEAGTSSSRRATAAEAAGASETAPPVSRY